MGARSGRGWVLAVGLLIAGPAWAGEGVPPCHAPAVASAGLEAGAGAETRVALVNAPLVDRTGRQVHFPEDVVGDGVVVVNFVFTTCTTVCPALSSLFSALQDRLGDRLEREVRLVTIAIDPARDTPARLAAMAERHRARPGWRWLTGTPEAVERVLRGLGAYVPRPADHAPVVLVGDPRTGRWYRHNGFPSTETLAARIDGLLAARATATEAAR